MRRHAKFRPAAGPRAGLRARLQFSRLLKLPEAALADEVRRLEGSDLFRRLVDLGVVVQETSAVRLAARRSAGYELRGSADGLGDLLDPGGDLARLMTRLGQDMFEDEFLRGEPRSDAERALRCGISKDEARRLRELVDRLYVQEELGARPQEAPTARLSAVAGIAVEAGRPVLAFFHREIWKSRYRVDDRRRDDFLSALPHGEARRVGALLRKLQMIDRRKTTLYGLLEFVIEAQAEYFLTRDPLRRRPLSQREAAARLGVCASVMSRLVSNKAVELPWGVDVPLKELLPSRKTVLRDRLGELAADRPGLSAAQLARELEARFGVRLSRQSISLYRIESGLSPRQPGCSSLTEVRPTAAVAA